MASLLCCGSGSKRSQHYKPEISTTSAVTRLSVCHEIISNLGCILTKEELDQQLFRSLNFVVSSLTHAKLLSEPQLRAVFGSNLAQKSNPVGSTFCSGERRVVQAVEDTDNQLRSLLQIPKQSQPKFYVLCPFLKSDTLSEDHLLLFSCDNLSKEVEYNLALFEKQLKTTLQRLEKVEKNFHRLSGLENHNSLIVLNHKDKSVDMSEILNLCADLYDQDADLLQKKVLKYLIRRTNAETGFILLYSDDTAELLCQVVGEYVHQETQTLNVSSSIFADCIENGSVMKLTKCTEDQLAAIKHVMGPAYIDIRSFICQPVRHRKTKRVIALACMVNKRTSDRFSAEDEAAIEECFWYTASVLTSTISLQTERRLKQQTEKLLEVAKNIFRRMDNLNELLREIMQEARNITQAERCSVFLMDRDTKELVAKVFDGLPTTSEKDDHPVEIRIPSTQGICGHVATTGEMLNIKDAYSHPLFFRGVDDETGFRTRNILCFPIQDENGENVGVAQLCNKINGQFFTKSDEEIARAFSIYCCISIVHSLMYKKVEDAQHRSRLANELMTYHMQVSDDNVKWLTSCQIPPTTDFLPDFDKLSSIPRQVKEKDSLLATLSMFDNLGLIQRWRMHRRTLASFILMVKRGYRDPPYHNWSHAFSVGHFIYLCAKNFPLDKQLTDLEMAALYVASLCHDIDHRGTNNTFQEQSKSVLAALYSSEGSVLERHHFSQTVCILNTEGCNPFENLSKQEYSRVLDLIRDIILATDLAHHLRIFKQIKEMAEHGYDASSSEHHNLLLCLLMTSADLSDQTKNWRNTRAVAELIYKEFFGQGDLEKALGKKPCEQMDRERACVPDLQISFLDSIILPLYKTLGTLYPNVCDGVIETIQRNRANWRVISEDVKSGRIKATGDDIFGDEKLNDDDYVADMKSH